MQLQRNDERLVNRPLKACTGARGVAWGNNLMSKADEATRAGKAHAAADEAAIMRELATLITQAINLDVPPDQIDPDAPLYGEGLGLDSIDILEIALVVAKRYDLQLKADSDENTVIFKSLRQLARYVAARVKPSLPAAEVIARGCD